MSKEGKITVDQGGENVREEHLYSFCVKGREDKLDEFMTASS